MLLTFILQFRLFALPSLQLLLLLDLPLLQLLSLQLVLMLQLRGTRLFGLLGRGLLPLQLRGMRLFGLFGRGLLPRDFLLLSRLLMLKFLLPLYPQTFLILL